MYKSKLQEMCQKQKWALPKYTCVEDGEDHCPQFMASVVVQGLVFQGPSTARSLKQAHNDAAHLAFLHFTSGRKEEEKPNNEKQEIQTSLHSKDMDMKQSSQDKFKKKLQMYTIKKNLDSPIYQTEEECLHYTTRVYIGEKCYHSQGNYQSLDESENAVAQIALVALTTNALHQDGDMQSYKILLQELIDDGEEHFMPKYTTIVGSKLGLQTFSSTVEVEGEVFQGGMAKTKELAEISAAKAAYTVFMERKLFQPPFGVTKLAPRENSIKPNSSTKFCSVLENETGEQGNLAEKTTERTLVVSTSIGKATLLNTEKHNESNEADYFVDHTTGSQAYSDCRMETVTATEIESYLLCNRVKVFTSIPPNTVLPKGMVVLPISENRWTIASIEFPHEKGK